MALFQRIRGEQINLSDTSVDVAADSFAFKDADESIKVDTIADLIAAIAGVGLAAASGVLAIDLNELVAAAVDVTTDSIAIIDAGDNSSKKESIDDLISALAGDGLQNSSSLFAVDVSAFAGKGVKDDGSENLDMDINGLDIAAVDVANDSIAILDNGDSESKKESIADLITAIAGVGLTATAGVLSVDTITDNLIESDIKLEDETANCDGAETEFVLSSTPVANSVQAFLNGMYLAEGSGKSFTLTGDTLTFPTPPDADDTLFIHYIANN